MGKAPTELEIAWAAGLFEGEGCISFRTRMLKGGVLRRYPNLQLSMGDRDVVGRFARIMGCGNVFRFDGPSRPEHWTVMWKWCSAKRSDVLRLHGMLMPYLGARRAARFDEVLTFYADDGYPRRFF